MANLPLSRTSHFPSQKQMSKFSIWVLPLSVVLCLSWWLLSVILFLSQPAGHTETASLSCILVSLIRRRLLLGFLMTTHTCHIHTSDPLEAEALTLNWALDYISTAITSDDEKEYVIYTDYKILSTAIQMNNVQDLPYWEAVQTVAQCVTTFQQL
ncbi:hypothetical protein FCM35_KLT17749 [Carex littledalei]|uniref:Uncharacterized protein n=1 Tax=Carex littledalei TaxID=544730 RepID=A0A833RE98_9POAL|nr:hypothetical protein FCM35_KLT17749 [Carex littledalei]